MDIETVKDALAALRQMGRQVKVRRRGRWLAQCPAHDDNVPSLSLRAGERVGVLLHCHAGCAFEDILAVLRGERPPVALSGCSSSKHQCTTTRVIQWYDYRDEVGRLLYQHGRTRDKEFPFRMPGATTWGLDPGVRRLLYRLPALAAAPAGAWVFVVEGEKDADRLAALSLIATTSDGGAGVWPATYAPYFAGNHVFILPDNDLPGREHGLLVARCLHPVAAGVRVVQLPGLPEAGDVSDWLDQGYDLKALLDCYFNSPRWQPESTLPASH